MQSTRQYPVPLMGVASVAVWHAVYTRHQHEKTVAEILTNKGFETLLPLYQSARCWKDRTKVISLPLFPCYVFVKVSCERRLDILTTGGLYAFVSSAGWPIPIPAVEVEAMRRAVESGARLEPHPFLKSGDLVRIKYGPLAGVQGILVRKKNVHRLVLSVEMLGKAAALEVDALLIERLNSERRVVLDVKDKAPHEFTNPRTIALVGENSCSN